MERCAKSRQGSVAAPYDIPVSPWMPIGPGHLCAPVRSVAATRPPRDPVIAERRSRRRRAVAAGLTAIVLLGGGMAGVLHRGPARPPAVERQAGATP